MVVTLLLIVSCIASGAASASHPYLTMIVPDFPDLVAVKR
jgi:hypothetical protein